MVAYIRSTQSEAVEMDDEWVILHADRFTVTKLNEVGGVIWSLLGEPQTVQSLSNELRKEYDIPEETAREDVEHFLAKLTDIGLIQHAG